MAATPPLGPHVPLPAQPNDPNIQLPNAPAAPPNEGDVLRAVEYRQRVQMSCGMYCILRVKFHTL
jgi:hypothetical protein